MHVSLAQVDKRLLLLLIALRGALGFLLLAWPHGSISSERRVLGSSEHHARGVLGRLITGPVLLLLFRNRRSLLQSMLSLLGA